MTQEDGKKKAEYAAEEADLIKKAMAYNESSQYYEEEEDLEQYKIMKEKAIETFGSKAAQLEDSYEKALVCSYQALCWICLEEYENAKVVLNDISDLQNNNCDFIPPAIFNFAQYLAMEEVEKAERLWRDIHDQFHPNIVKLLEEAFVRVNPKSEPPRIKEPVELTMEWVIVMAGKGGDVREDWKLIFYDASQIFNTKMILKREFMDDLIKKVEDLDHYHFVKSIRTVTSPSGEDFSEKAIDIVLATSAEKELKFGVIFGHLKDGGVHILGVWPKAFAEAMYEDNEIIGAFITRLIKQPDWFADINLITYLSKGGNVKEGKLKKGVDSSYYT
jgi:tetratricopeptide (TPR) repeat protein